MSFFVFHNSDGKGARLKAENKTIYQVATLIDVENITASLSPGVGIRYVSVTIEDLAFFKVTTNEERPISGFLPTASYTTISERVFHISRISHLLNTQYGIFQLYS
jgi:hypothetical protein